MNALWSSARLFAVACPMVVGLGVPALAAAQYQPPPVRGFTEPMAMPTPDAGAVPSAESEQPYAVASDPASLGPGQFVFEAGSGVPVAFGAVDLGLGRGFALGVEGAYHVESTLRFAGRIQWGIAWQKVSLAAALEAALPVYLEDRDIAPDSINDADFSFALRLRGAIRLSPSALLYLEPVMRVAVDGSPPIDALSGPPAETELAPAFGAGVGAAMRLTGALGLHAVARGESGANRSTQSVEFRFGLTLTTDALLRPAARPEQRRSRETARR